MKFPSLVLFLALAATSSAPALAAESSAAVENQGRTGLVGSIADPVPLTGEDLSQISAGESVKTDVLTNQQLTATNSGNTITAASVVNGDITFSDNALSGFNGVGNFVSNTGNNNNLQGSISVTIVTSPTLP